MFNMKISDLILDVSLSVAVKKISGKNRIKIPAGFLIYISLFCEL